VAVFVRTAVQQTWLFGQCKRNHETFHIWNNHGGEKTWSDYYCNNYVKSGLGLLFWPTLYVRHKNIQSTVFQMHNSLLRCKWPWTETQMSGHKWFLAAYLSTEIMNCLKSNECANISNIKSFNWDNTVHIKKLKREDTEGLNFYTVDSWNEFEAITTVCMI